MGGREGGRKGDRLYLPLSGFSATTPTLYLLTTHLSSCSLGLLLTCHVLLDACGSSFTSLALNLTKTCLIPFSFPRRNYVLTSHQLLLCFRSSITYLSFPISTLSGEFESQILPFIPSPLLGTPHSFYKTGCSSEGYL